MKLKSSDKVSSYCIYSCLLSRNRLAGLHTYLEKARHVYFLWFFRVCVQFWFHTFDITWNWLKAACFNALSHSRCLPVLAVYMTHIIITLVDPIAACCSRYHGERVNPFDWCLSFMAYFTWILKRSRISSLPIIMLWLWLHYLYIPWFFQGMCTSHKWVRVFTSSLKKSGYVHIPWWLCTFTVTYTCIPSVFYVRCSSLESHWRLG